MSFLYLVSILIFITGTYPHNLVQSVSSKNDEALSEVFTTGYSDQLLSYTVDEATSHVAFDEPCTVEPQFSFGHVSQTFDSIYFVHEVNDYDGNPNTGAVSRWKISSSPSLQLDQDPSNEMYQNETTMRGTSITKEEVFLTNGEGPCHVILDEEHGILHVANYGGGSYVAYSVDKTNGEILEEIFFEDYGKGSNVDPDRQADAHAHMAFFIKEFIYVVDLGSDKIHHYKIIDKETKEIVKDDPTFLPPGFGPRHMTATTTFPEGEQRVYVINELQPYIYIFKLDDTFGILRDQGTVHTVHRPGQAGAELALHPTERWLYCSNRVLDGSGGSILVYKVLMDGNLENIQVQPTYGSMPRHFTISQEGDDDMMFVVDQNGNTLETFLIDENTGKLTKKEMLESGNNPTFVGLL